MNHGAPAAAAAAAPDGDVAAWVALLDGLPGAAWLVALATQRVVAVNAAAAALFCRAAQVLVGESAPRLAGSPEDLAYWAAAESGEAGLLQSDQFFFPVVILPPTYLYAGATVVGAGVVSALIVRNRIDNLDLVSVLKTRE